ELTRFAERCRALPRCRRLVSALARGADLGREGGARLRGGAHLDQKEAHEDDRRRHERFAPTHHAMGLHHRRELGREYQRVFACTLGTILCFGCSSCRSDIASDVFAILLAGSALRPSPSSPAALRRTSFRTRTPRASCTSPTSRRATAAIG